MKTVIYLSKKKVWAGDQEIDWDGVNLSEVFGKVKKELKINEARVVLGNDVSFVTSMKAPDSVLTRENVLKMARAWMPFPIDNDCFDWKEIELVPGEKWLQLVAMEREFLESLSAAVINSGVKVVLVTAVGVLLAKKTVGREAPVVLKWTGRENLIMVAVNGLADLVTGDISEEEIMTYAKQKWGLAVNPEEIVLTEAEMNLKDIVYGEKSDGEDSLVLNLPILKEVIEKKEEVGEGEKNEGVIQEAEKKKPSRLWIYLIGLVVILAACGGVLFKLGVFANLFKQETKKAETEVTVTPTETPSPTVEAVDLTNYKVQVLNGTGITGEAARIKTMLTEAGFAEIEVGNTTATSESQIRLKEEVPEAVSSEVVSKVGDYSFGIVRILTNEDKYDLIVVVGK